MEICVDTRAATVVESQSHAQSTTVSQLAVG